MKKLSSLLLALAGSLACSGANGVPSHIVQPLPRELDPRLEQPLTPPSHIVRPLTEEETARRERELAPVPTAGLKEDGEKAIQTYSAQEKTVDGRIQEFRQQHQIAGNTPAPAAETTSSSAASGPEEGFLQANSPKDLYTVDCDGDLYFDMEEGVLVFMKNVRVRNPGLSLDCADHLKVYAEFVPKKPGDKKPSDIKKEKGKGRPGHRHSGRHREKSEQGCFHSGVLQRKHVRQPRNQDDVPPRGQKTFRPGKPENQPQTVSSFYSSPLLSAEGICKTYKTRTVVDQVSLKVGHGEIVGLLGPNGAGKTTSFYMVAGLVRPDEGRVIFADEDITELPMNLRARRGMGYLPQEESIFRKLSVEDNLLAILQTRKDMTSRQQKDRAVELMDRFGITKLRRSMAIQLSGGEKRRLTIARALATSPKLLMLDEPFSGVDPIAVSDIQKIVMELRDTDGLSILITDHNVRETLHIVDRAYILFEGKVIKHGTSEEIANDPIARKQYLGDQFRM